MYVCQDVVSAAEYSMRVTKRILSMYWMIIVEKERKKTTRVEIRLRQLVRLSQIVMQLQVYRYGVIFELEILQFEANTI